MHGDIRAASDFEALPAADWVIDAAANPSVLAGIAGGFSSRQLFEHNLASTGERAGILQGAARRVVLLSTSRVYSIPALASLPLRRRRATLSVWTSQAACRRRFGARHRRRLLHRARRFRSTAAPSWPAKRWRSNTARLRLSGVDQPLRRAGRRGTVRHARSGHLRVLDQCPPAAASAALHRFRRHRQAGARRLPSARSGRAARSRRCAQPRSGGQRIYTRRRRPGQRDVARAVDRLVRRALRRPCAGADPRDRGPTTFPGWSWIRRDAARDFGWRPRHPLPTHPRRDRRATPRHIPTGWRRSGAVKQPPARQPQSRSACSPSSFPARDEEGAHRAPPSSTCTWNCGCTASRTKSWWWTTAAPTAPGQCCRKLASRVPTLRPVQNTASTALAAPSSAASTQRRATPW